MKTCKTCAWHGKSGELEPEEVPTKFGNQERNGASCSCPKFYEDSGYNDEPPEGDDYFATDHFVYSYHEGGDFWSGDSFGCIHHKQKEAADVR